MQQLPIRISSTRPIHRIAAQRYCKKMRYFALKTNFPTSEFCRLRPLVNSDLVGFFSSSVPPCSRTIILQFAFCVVGKLCLGICVVGVVGGAFELVASAEGLLLRNLLEFEHCVCFFRNVGFPSFRCASLFCVMSGGQKGGQVTPF